MGDDSGGETIEAGWQTDPTGRFGYRYHDGAGWTEHVSTDGVTSSDPLQAPPGGGAPAASSASRVLSPATAAVPGSSAVIELPDSPEQTQRRRLLGTVLLGCMAVVGVSLVLPWVSGAPEYSDGSPQSLTGINVGTGTGVGFLCLFVALYAWQAFARPRVRYSIAAAAVLLGALGTSFTYSSNIGDGELARLGVSGPSSSGASVDVPIFGEFGFSIGDERDRGFDSEDLVEADIGLQIAIAAQLVAIVPLAALWLDDRRRRRDVGLIL